MAVRRNGGHLRLTAEQGQQIDIFRSAVTQCLGSGKGSVFQNQGVLSKKNGEKVRQAGRTPSVLATCLLTLTLLHS